MSSRLPLSRNGFTLVELLITIAILGVLAAIILPLLSRRGHRPSRRYTCLNNVKQLVLACYSYESINGTYPPVIGSSNESFLVRILPLLEQKPLYDDFRTETNKSIAIDNLAGMEMQFLRCSSAASSDFQANANGFTSHYVGCAGFATPISATGPAPAAYTLGPGDLGLNGFFSPKLNDDGTLNIGNKNGITTDDVPDGLSNTMAIIETSRGDSTTFTNSRVRWSWGIEPTNPVQVNWGRSVDRTINSFDDVASIANPLHGICISSEHSGGANIANGDGSVHFVSEDQDLEVLQAAAGINDGIDVDLDDY